MNTYPTDCTTLHPSLDQFIPKDLLPEEPDNLIHPYPTTYYYYSTRHNLYI